jgi:hypothetical protein
MRVKDEKIMLTKEAAKTIFLNTIINKPFNQK